MKREEFEHVIRAAAAIVDDELVVIGSQAILAQHPNAPASLLVSLEVDLYPLNHRERTDEIDGSLGDGSPFHATFDYYAHGVGPETAIAPAGWEGRLVKLELSTLPPSEKKVIAWCLEVHDLVLAKLAAGRPHDFAFAEEAIRSRLVDREQLLFGVDLMPESHRARTRERLIGLFARIDS